MDHRAFAFILGLLATTLVLAEDPPAEVDLPLEGARVIEPYNRDQRAALDKCSELLTIVSTAKTDDEKALNSLIKLISISSKADREYMLPPNFEGAIVSVGPELDSPDKVHIKRLVRRGDAIELEIVHTKADAVDRNVPWRPLVEVPLTLPEGKYTVTVTWRAVKSIPDGEARPDREPVVLTTKLQVIELKVR